MLGTGFTVEANWASGTVLIWVGAITVLGRRAILASSLLFLILVSSSFTENLSPSSKALVPLFTWLGHIVCTARILVGRASSTVKACWAWQDVLVCAKLGLISYRGKYSFAKSLAIWGVCLRARADVKVAAIDVNWGICVALFLTVDTFGAFLAISSAHCARTLVIGTLRAQFRLI